MPIFVPDEIVTAAKLNAATSRDWADWTPSYTNLNVGSTGSTVARFVQIGKTVYFYWLVTLGGSGISVGDVRVSLPVTSTSNHVGLMSPFGVATLADTGSANYSANCLFASISTFAVRYWNTGVANVIRSQPLSATVPFTWAATDQMAVSGFYEVA